MALDTQYHCSIKLVSRSAGRSAVAAAAYRSGSVLRDERTGLEHDYRRKRGVVLSEIVAPPGCNWALDRARLWNAVEGTTRKNGRVASEVEVALPAALTDEQRAALVRGFAAELAAAGVAVDYNIHAPHPHRRPRDGADGSDLPGDDARNHHAHILCSHLPVTPNGPGKPVSKLFDGPAAVEAIRQRWAVHVNAAYVAAGINDMYQDARSYAAQGIDRIPTKHLGPTVAALERGGIVTERGNIHRVKREARRASIAIALLDGEQQRRAARRQRPPPPDKPPPAAPKPPPSPHLEVTPMTQKYTSRGRFKGRGGKPLPRLPEQRQSRRPHEQDHDTIEWLWGKAYGPTPMPKNWLKYTTAMWTFSEDGYPNGINVQLFGNAGRLHDDGNSVTWEHVDTPTGEHQAAAIEAMLDLAIDGRGWNALSFFGSQPFRAAAARAATRRGIICSDADLQDVVADEQRRMAEQPTPAPGVITNGIAQAIPPVPAAAIIAAGPPTQPSPTVTAFLAAGREARNSSNDLSAWLALYAARLTNYQREEISAHLAAGQPAGAAKWARATESVLTVEALTAAQARGDTRSLRSILDVTPPDRRQVIGDLLHQRADTAVFGSPTDFADLRRRSAAQALAQSWDRMCDESARAKQGGARVTEPPPPPPTIADIRRMGEALLTARRAGSGDPYDTVRADRALDRALDRAPPETRRALADALTDRPGTGADPLASMLAVAALAADDCAAGMAGMSEEWRHAVRPPIPGQTVEREPPNINEYEAKQPDFMA